jgi:hypothetical protein
MPCELRPASSRGSPFHSLAATQMAVRLVGQLLWTEYLRSQYLHYRPRPWLAIAGTVILALIVWASYVTISDWVSGSGPWILAVICVVTLLYLVFYVGVIIPISAYRIFKQQKSLNLPFSIEATPGAFCAFNETGKTTMPWSHFVKWKESERLLLLYHSDILFNLVPKRLFQSDAELAEFRGFLGGVRRVS